MHVLWPRVYQDWQNVYKTWSRHISSIARLTTETIIKPQIGKVCLCRLKGNEYVLNSKWHQVIAAENRTLNQEPGLIVVNSIVKVTKQGKFLAFIRLQQGSKIGKVEPIRECDFVNISNYPRPEKVNLQWKFFHWGQAKY